MKKTVILCCTLMMAVLLVSPACAEIKAKTYSISPFIGGYTFEGGEDLKTRPVYGLRFGYDFTRHWGMEGALDFVRTESNAADTDADVYGYRLEGLYHFLPQNKLVPFLAAGMGGRTLRYDKILNDRNHLLFDYGAGLKYFLTERLALRADVRHLFLTNDNWNNLEYTLGITYYFGGAPAAAAPAPVDSDRDGVYDDKDMCPDTPAGVKVDANGCPLDSDKDGVPDYLDKCPGTPIGVSVDKNGCPPVAKKVEPEAPVVVERKKEPEAASAMVAKEMLEKGRATINIEFDFDKAVIKPVYHDEIKKFADVMTQYPDLDVVIEGHTDSVGAKAYNQKLSEKRANSVRSYLIKKFGIAESRLTAKGHGMSKPIDSNKTVEGRKKNRRVEAAVDYTIKKKR